MTPELIFACKPIVAAVSTAAFRAWEPGLWTGAVLAGIMPSKIRPAFCRIGTVVFNTKQPILIFVASVSLFVLTHLPSRPFASSPPG